MEYDRPQLMADKYDNGKTSDELTPEQREAILAIKRPQLQEEIYRGFGDLEPLNKYLHQERWIKSNLRLYL